jgi:drug/metabolite transporter (DMT)-like permease
MITFNQGILFCIVQALLWSLLPVFVKLGFTTTSPLLSLAVINSFAFLAFGSLMGYKRRWGELTRTEVWPYIVANAVLNGLIYYSMVFIGTKLSTAGNAAILLLLEAPFALLLLGTSGHDKVTGRDIIGTALTLLAAALVVWPEQWSWNAGDLLVLFFNGFIVLGVSRLLWIEAIQVVPISKANSISSVSPIFTLLAAWAILNEIPTESQIFSLVPMFLGLQLLMKAK